MWYILSVSCSILPLGPYYTLHLLLIIRTGGSMYQGHNEIQQHFFC